MLQPVIYDNKKSAFSLIFSWLLLQLYSANYGHYSVIDPPSPPSPPPPPIFAGEIVHPAICLIRKKVVPFHWTNLLSAFMLLNETDLPQRQCVLNLKGRHAEGKRGKEKVGEENHKWALMHMFDKDK